MRFIAIALAISFLSINAVADTIEMYGKEQFGYSQPRYKKLNEESRWRDEFQIRALAKADNFPFSSMEQGSVFNKIFEDLAEKKHIKIVLTYSPKNYEQLVTEFERGKVLENTNFHFGVYYEETPYSKNQLIYPSFFENQIYIITSARNKLSLKSKNELKNYKGIYVEKDNFSSFVLKDFASLGMDKVKDFPTAFEELLGGKVDYIAASYYPSQIELYKLGIRDYVTYSQSPVWKIPMFLRSTPGAANHPRLEELKAYFKTPRYKKICKEAFEELLEIYKENTKGIVPPTYVNMAPPEEEKNDAAAEQKEETALEKTKAENPNTETQSNPKASQ